MPPIRQSPLVLYLVMVFGFALGWLYVSQTDPARSVPQVPAALQLTTLRQLQNLKIDFSILSDPQFQELRAHGELPVQAGAGGRADPFQ
jgi:hypothetical protein